MISPLKTKLILFDLDGTLVDSAPDLAWCGDEMMRQLEMPERGLDAARSWVGNGIERFVKRVLTNEMDAEPEPGIYSQGLGIFRSLYADNTCTRSFLYPGVLEGLQKLDSADVQLACVTNKAQEFTQKLIDIIGLKPFFELVVSGDTTPRKKPDPMPLHYAADHYDLNYEDCLMVGDSSNDVKAARSAGFNVVCVPYGYNHGEDIRDARPDYIVDSIDELAAVFLNNCNSGINAAQWQGT